MTSTAWNTCHRDIKDGRFGLTNSVESDIPTHISSHTYYGYGDCSLAAVVRHGAWKNFLCWISWILVSGPKQWMEWNFWNGMELKLKKSTHHVIFGCDSMVYTLAYTVIVKGEGNDVFSFIYIINQTTCL